MLAAPAGAPEAGRSLPVAVGEGRYRVQRLLGEGSRKVVYAASDTRLGRDVAVAVIKTDGLDDAGRRRIEREARAMARLGDHPNIVTVFDVGDDDGEPYIVSELMPGGSVADALEQRRRAPARDRRRAADRRAGRARARARARARRRAPRPQARQRVARRRRHGAARRLRARGRGRPLAHHLGGHGRRHRRVPRARAGPRPRARRAQRPLRARARCSTRCSPAGRRSSATTRSPSSRSTSTPRRSSPVVAQREGAAAGRGARARAAREGSRARRPADAGAVVAELRRLRGRAAAAVVGRAAGGDSPRR